MIPWNKGKHPTYVKTKEFKEICSKAKLVNKSTVGLKYIHFGKNIEKRVKPELINDYLLKGWQLGRHPNGNKNRSLKLKGKTPWNKGLTKETDGRIEKQSNTQKQFQNKQLKRQHIIEKYGSIENYNSIWRKNIQHSMKLNNSFNKSKMEDQLYYKLLQYYNKNDIERQYRSIEYPYSCDFYIKSINTFIECNFHWTHGNDIYTNSDEQRAIIESWKSKNTKYYDSAINTWTIRDLKKLNTAIFNNLNFIIIYINKIYYYGNIDTNLKILLER